jgi:hypothetical protein
VALVDEARKMKRVAAIICLVTAIGCMPAAARSATSDTDEFRREYRRAYDGLRGSRCAEFVADAVELLALPQFEQGLGRNEKYGFLVALERCAGALGQREVLYRTAAWRVRIQPKEQFSQVVRLGYGVEFGDPEATLQAFEHFLAHDPAFLRKVPLSAVTNVMYAADLLDPTGERKLAALEALARIGYDGALPSEGDVVRFAAARLMLARGRAAEARERLDGVTNVVALALMRVDALFVPLRADPAFESRLDPPAALERDLARVRAAVEDDEESLILDNLLATRLKWAARNEEALQLVDVALARATADPRDYADGYYHRRLLFGTRSELLVELGRTDDAVAAMLDGANQREYRRANVTEMIMLGRLLVELGRGDEMLPLLPRITGTSLREQAWVEAIRSCAGAQVGNEALRTEGLDYLRAREADGPAALSQALLCSGDVEAAAALMVRRLERQGTSADALLALQERSGLRRDELPYRKILLQRFAELRAREDVRDAAAAVGRVEPLHIALPGEF